LEALPATEAVELAADRFGTRWQADVPVQRQGRIAVVRTIWIIRTGEAMPRFVTCWILCMSEPTARDSLVLSVVALLGDRQPDGLVRGQVGTVVEDMGEGVVLVEFSDDQGRAYALASCPVADLLMLHYVSRAA
jgi:hypothetical protein